MPAGKANPSGFLSENDAPEAILVSTGEVATLQFPIPTILQIFQNALNKIESVGGYEFDWNEELKSEHGYYGHDIGVIAQEIEEIAPELVSTRGNGYKAVKYEKIVPLLIQAIKELSAKVKELENK